MAKIYRFDYSPYAHKVQCALDLLGRSYQVVEVPYNDRTELLALTGGALAIPVFVDDDGKVVQDSRRICAHLAAGPGGELLVPPRLAGPVWAYADFCDGPLEDVLFRLASPGIRRRFATLADRALYTLIKERRYGAGCVDDWDRQRAELLRRGQELMVPTLTTLGLQPFLFGEDPTLADAALYGQFMMVEIGGQDLAAFGPTLTSWKKRLGSHRSRATT
jgi:glutathione S-transferase